MARQAPVGILKHCTHARAAPCRPGLRRPCPAATGRLSSREPQCLQSYVQHSVKRKGERQRLENRTLQYEGEAAAAKEVQHPSPPADPAAAPNYCLLRTNLGPWLLLDLWWVFWCLNLDPRSVPICSFSPSVLEKERKNLMF